MKIGILTLPLHSNYGGILQAYALQTILEKMGHEVVVFNTKLDVPPIKWSRVPKRIVKKILGKDSVIFKEWRRKREQPVIMKNIENFINEYIHQENIDYLSSLKRNCVDAIVVGSDQVWRPLYFKKMWKTSYEDAFLNFAKDWNIKRLAYAASFGVDFWELKKNETNAINKLASMFNGVSVRESSAVDLMKKNLGMNVLLHVDPTMLLDRGDYENLFRRKDCLPSKGSLLIYILDKNKDKNEFVDAFVKRTKLTPFSVNRTFVKENAPIEQRVLPSVETWLRGFFDAEYVITDSFHACVFSIIFNKPFYVLQNAERGNARFLSLLRMFDLEQCLIDAKRNIGFLNDLSVNFSHVNELLVKQRKCSFDFFYNVLKV